MKIRSGFVSNSSSSSFIVIDASQGYDFPKYNGKIVIDGSFGETEFGWGPDVIYDVGSRIIFSYIQAKEARRKSWLNMLEKVIKNNTGADEIEWKLSMNYSQNGNWAYIDHQSSAIEGMNTEMFNSEAALKDFIFGRDSRIELDSDNH